MPSVRGPETEKLWGAVGLSPAVKYITGDLLISDKIESIHLIKYFFVFGAQRNYSKNVKLDPLFCANFLGLQSHELNIENTLFNLNGHLKVCEQPPLNHRHFIHKSKETHGNLVFRIRTLKIFISVLGSMICVTMG